MKTSARIEKSENNISGPAGATKPQNNFKATQGKLASGPAERAFGREMDINSREAGKAPGANTIMLKVSSAGKNMVEQNCSSARGTAADIKTKQIVSRIASTDAEAQPTIEMSFSTQQSLKQRSSNPTVRVYDEAKEAEVENPEETSSNGLIKCMKIATTTDDTNQESKAEPEESKQSDTKASVLLTQEKLKSAARVKEQWGDRLINFRMEIIETIPLADQRNFRNQQEVAYYAQDIYLNMREEERIKKISPTFLKDVQLATEVKDTSRAFLIEWIIDVHRKFRLLPEALYVSVFIVDRFLSKKRIKKTDLHILGITSLLIATKYEEIYPPELKDLLTVAENKFTHKEVIVMERTILNAIQFEVTQPSAYRFLERYHKLSAFSKDEKVFFLAQYLQEMAMLDASLLKYSPSEIAAAALILSTKQIKKAKAWNSEMETVTLYKEAHLRPIIEDIESFAIEVNPKFLTTLKYKFTKKEFGEVANITLKF